jgi:hypothetical protein
MTGWIDHAAGLVGIRMRRLCRVRRSRMEKRPCDRDKFGFSILLEILTMYLDKVDVPCGLACDGFWWWQGFAWA